MDRGSEGISAQCRCRDRAGLMRILSAELMELGADYSDGIDLKGRNFELHIRPSAELSALNIAVKSQNEEFAKELLGSAVAAVAAIENPNQ